MCQSLVPGGELPVNRLLNDLIGAKAEVEKLELKEAQLKAAQICNLARKELLEFDQALLTDEPYIGGATIAAQEGENCYSLSLTIPKKP